MFLGPLCLAPCCRGRFGKGGNFDFPKSRDRPEGALKTPTATRQLRCSPCSLLSINCFCIGQWPAVFGVPEGLCSLGTSEPLPTLSGCVSCIFWLARAVLAVLLCILRSPRAALAGPPILTCVLYLVSVSASCIRALTLPCLSVSCLHIVSVSVSCTRTYSYDGASVCVWHRLGHVFGVHTRGHVRRYIYRPVKPLLHEVGYPQRPQLKP